MRWHVRGVLSTVSRAVRWRVALLDRHHATTTSRYYSPQSSSAVVSHHKNRHSRIAGNLLCLTLLPAYRCSPPPPPPTRHGSNGQAPTCPRLVMAFRLLGRIVAFAAWLIRVPCGISRREAQGVLRLALLPLSSSTPRFRGRESPEHGHHGPDFRVRHTEPFDSE